MEKEKRKMIVAIDFDGTITKKTYYPNIGKLQDNVKDVINFLHDVLNIEIIIWTCRDNSIDNDLDQAIEFLNKNDIHYDLVNTNSESIKKIWNKDGRKVYSDYIIDDRAFLFEKIDWLKIKEFFINKKEQRKNDFL